MAKQVKVHVTHFESPTQFYFRFEDSEQQRAQNKSCLWKIESEVSKVSRDVLQKESTRVCGSIVGYLHYKRLGWERAKIVKVFPNGALKVFLCDRGYFMDLYRENEHKIIDLPRNLQKPSEIIHEGSLAIQPCDKVQDRETSTVIYSPVRYWDQRAISFVKNYNKKKGCAELDWRLALIKTEVDGTYFGDLLLKNPLETISLSEELMKQNLAISCDGMQLDQKPLSIRPSSNFRKIIEKCCPEIMVQKTIVVTQKSSAIFPIGVGLESNRTDRSPKPPIVLQQPTVLFPSNILVFGEHLRPAFKSLDTTTFTPEIIDYLKTRLSTSTLTNVQCHVWPQIICDRSIVIVPVSGSSSFVSMTFLPPLINNIMLSCKAGGGGVGPAIIVIAKSSSDVKDVLRLCTSLAPFLKIAVLGIESKVVQLINGCDLLLTTPLAFVHMVEGTKINLFNRNRIRTLVFHEVDQLIPKFDSEVNEIVRRCSYGHKNVDKNPQIIVTSKKWLKNLEKFTVLIPPSKLVFCVESFIEAAALCRINIVMEVSSNDESKFENLSKDFKSGNYKNRRTAVVANDEKGFQFLVEKLSEASVQVSSANQSNFEIVKTSWLREKTGKYSVLVATDSTLVGMNLTQIQNLVHFSIPNTWSIFAQRFSTLIKSFYECLEKKIKPDSIATKIFIDEEKNHKEYLHLVKFMESRKMSIPETMIESVKILLHREEQRKCNVKVPICDKIWMFGECTDFPCLLRHVFASYDASSEHFLSKSAIKFEVVTVQSPKYYVIKILSEKIGPNWTSLEEMNRQTEALLSNELQEFCASLERLKKTEIKAAESYVALFEKTWRRCVAIKNVELNDPLCQIHLIDEGRDVHCKSSNIYILPDQFKKQAPLVCKLCVINLVPFHGENCWSPDGNKKVEEMIKGYGDDYVFVTDIKFTVQNTLFCNSFKAERSEFVKIVITNKLTKFCVKDETASMRLLKLFRDASLIPENPPNRPEIAKIEPTETTQKRTSETDEIKENWKQLSWNSFYDVRICHFKSPDSFFVRFACQHNKALLDIENTPVTEPLRNICVGTVCLVKRMTTQRGKILRVNDESVKVLLVDLGDVVNCQASDLFSVSKEIISKICFQSIHCRFVGVRPKYNMNTWPPKQCEAIEKLIREIDIPLRMYVLEKTYKIDELCIIGQPSYEVVLIDPRTGTHLDDMVVIKSYADRDKYEKPEDMENDFECGNDSDEPEVENRDDMLERMIASMIMSDLSETESAGEDDQVPSKTQPLESPAQEVQILNAISSHLSYLVKHPLIVWQQNEVKVHLMISAIDCVDYGLRIGDTTLDVKILYADSRFEKATIDLYCGIIPKLCSHERRGLNIVADLVKKEPNVEWPRLTEAKERSQFIRFSNENIKEVSNLHLHTISAGKTLESYDTNETRNYWDTEQLELSEGEDSELY